MVREKQANWLDKAIAETAPGQPPRADFAAWREAHPEALEALAQRAQRKNQPAASLPAAVEFGRRIMKSPITKLAAAAALIVGILILTNHLTGREVPGVAPRRAEDTVRRELALAHAMYVRNDVGGLLSLLETGKGEAKIKVAEYLGQIGDRSALSALQSFASQWQGAPDTNPFQKAIEAIEGIREPQEQPIAPPPDDAEPDTVSATEAEEARAEPLAVSAQQTAEKPEARADLVAYEGMVTDETGVGVAGVRVWGQALSDTFQNSVLAQETLTDAGGSFRLIVARPVEGSEILGTLRFDHPDYGLGWRTLAGSDSDENIEVTLYTPGVVAGVVVDTAGQPVASAQIEADVRLSANRQTDQLMLWDLTDAAQYANDKGEFVLDRLPAPASVRLRVSARGHALYTTPSDLSGKAFPVTVGEENLRIALEPGSAIAGRIVYADGAPYGRRAVIIAEGPGAHELVFATEDDGTFTSPGLSPGLYHLNALKDESKPLCAPVQVQVDLASGTAQVVLEVLPAGQPVAVQIVDETTGDPLEKVWVRAEFTEGGEGLVAEARTDATGHCTLAIPPGRYRIVAQGWKNGRVANRSEEITVEPDRTPDTVTLAISARRHIAGQLIDVDGNPVQGVVAIDFANRTKTDADGRFVVPEPFGNAFEYKPSWAFDTSGQFGKMFLFRKADYEDELVILLEPCVILTGRVVNGVGLVQADVKPRLGIELPGGGTGYHSGAPWNISVSEYGIFVIDRVPVGVPMRVRARRKGLQGGVNVDELVGGGFRDVGDIVLRGHGGIDENTDWTGTLEGRIIDENEEPVKGVTVRAYTGIDHFEAKTDRKGCYKLNGLPKGVRLNFNVYVPGYGHNHRYVYAESDDGDTQIFPQGWELLGKPAPPLSIAQWFNSPAVTLEELGGKVVLLQIGVLLPLYGEHLTTMQTMHEKYSEQGLELIAVHQPLHVKWGGKVTEEDIRTFVDQGKAPFTFCLDKERETYSAYAPKATPALYLIDREGHVVISPTIETVEEWVRELLAQ